MICSLTFQHFDIALCCAQFNYFHSHRIIREIQTVTVYPSYQLCNGGWHPWGTMDCDL